MGPVLRLAPWGLEARPQLDRQPVPNHWGARKVCVLREVDEVSQVGGRN